MGTISIGECHQITPAPSWKVVRLDVFEKHVAQQAILEIEEA